MAKQRKAPPGTYWRNGTLWGRLTVKGTERRWSLRTSDVEVARQRREAQRKREIAVSHYGDERKTWEDAVVAWTDHIASNVGPGTVKRYLVSLKQAEPSLLGCYLDEIDKALIGSFVKDRKRTGATNATVRRDLVAISSVLSFAEAEDWIGANPTMSWMKRLKEKRDPIVLPEPADIEAVIARAPGMLGKLIEAAWRTGCRQDELVTLTRNRVDLRRGQISVIGKGNKLRTLDMDEARPVFQAAAVHMKSKFVFWHGSGDPYANVASRFAALTASAHKSAQAEGREFRRFRFHDLRHRFAVDYLKARVGSVYDLQQHLGHSSVKVTEIYLAYLTPEEAALAKHGGSGITLPPAQKAAPVQRSAQTNSAQDVEQ